MFMKAVGWLLASSLLLSCGNPFQRRSSATEREEGAEKVEIGLELVQQGSGSALNLDLLRSYDFVIDVKGCASGWETTITSTQGAQKTGVPLYKNDINCMAKLKSFTFDGRSYLSATPTGLDTGSETFTALSGEELRVSVLSQIDDAIDASSKAVFVFQEIKIGADFEVSGYSESAELEVQGMEAPNVKVNSMSITSIDAAGLATFTVELECNAALTGVDPAGACPTAVGAADQPLTSMSLRLLSNDFGAAGVPGDPTYSQADAAFGAGVPVTASDSGIGANGGATVTGVVAEEQLHSHKDMLLLVRYEETIEGVAVHSYRYFKVHIGDPQ